MRVSDFDYLLPSERIAQYPLAERAAARLLVLETAAVEDRQVQDLPTLLRPGDLLVLNDTRVLPARLTGHKASGGRVEVLIERILSENVALAMIRASKSPPTGTRLLLEKVLELQVLGREGMFYRLELQGDLDFTTALHRYGHVPLPPYIRRPDQSMDRDRYQTVFAARDGAVAAPTAGLHLDAHLLQALRERGVQIVHITLHVGAGTFQPVKTEHAHEHPMHAEYAEVSAEVCQAIARCHAAGGRVVAIGTTVLRALESAAVTGSLQPFLGDTRLFITPGYRFRVVDRLFTNFHLPRSTLLMLVTAFGGYRRVLDAYAHAVQQAYRFFSYGDAMWLAPGSPGDLPPTEDPAQVPASLDPASPDPVSPLTPYTADPNQGAPA